MSRLADAALAALVRGAFALLRALGPDRAAALGASIARNLGPLTPVHRVTLDNIARAFPELPPAEHRRIGRLAWDNLGRTACEYVHLDRIWDYDPDHPERSRITTDAGPVLERLRDDGKPALLFTAHLANWELPAVAAQRHGLPTAVVYRMPNNRVVADQIVAIRGPLMGRLISTRRAGAFEMAAALERGEHLGMLVDQFFGRGQTIDFFGRPTKANPTLARLARRYDCPVYGVRVIRRPGLRFHVTTTGPLDLPRDPDGQVNVQAATQMINTVVEEWIREEPAQWLWFHRRWR